MVSASASIRSVFMTRTSAWARQPRPLARARVDLAQECGRGKAQRRRYRGAGPCGGADRLSGGQVDGRLAAGLAVAAQFEADLLAFGEVADARAFDRGDVDEHVLAAVIGLDEAVALLRIEPLHGSCRHAFHLSGLGERAGCSSAREDQILEEVEPGRNSMKRA